jgi:hypothetical protein
MTAQLHDHLWLEGDPEPWVVTAVAGDGGFSPESVGLSPRPFATSCWRGWHAAYRVVGDRLVLEQLNAGLSEADHDAARAGTGPLVDGRPPVKRRYRAQRLVGDGQWEEGEFERSEWTWEGLQRPVRFTGGWLVSRGFLKSLYVHMGFHPAWKYEHTRELALRDGVVVGLRDVSASMAALRGDLAGNDGPSGTSRERIAAWVEGTFTLRYPGLH